MAKQQDSLLVLKDAGNGNYSPLTLCLVRCPIAKQTVLDP